MHLFAVAKCWLHINLTMVQVHVGAHTVNGLLLVQMLCVVCTSAVNVLLDMLVLL